ncbi:hypothetical protein FE257_011476 [Aspergillus nanangensis]|uniref:Zn(2)-C6 fungal-type domain-containing protein n=1 Tax=Aspergillus nanangensis TaxID=2582783 RepID=A0AAD4CH86_ASPNN|nr:hypothetical protein FE257_011476 [Aspergillus nanangensis]
MSDTSPQQRQLAPGPSPPNEAHQPDSSPESYRSAIVDPSKKRVSMACLACKKSKRKCSGTAPCDNCRTFNRQCIFDETLDQRRRVAAKRTADELSYHRDMLNDLFRVMRAEDESYGLRLLEIIRDNSSADDIRAFIDTTLTEIEGSSQDSHVTSQILEDIRDVINVEGADPSFRPKVMDIHYLCGDLPYRVPAKPWTSVTSDGDLVSHLISLYFTWDYPFHSFLDRDVFIQHMAVGDPNTQFCSPFLVNALLSNACHFSDYSEAYVDPGDIVTKGADFLAEAERLRESETARRSLAFLQGTLLLYERYSISGNNDLGYKMLHQAIWTGKSLGLIGPRTPHMTSDPTSNDMDISVRRTAWGLFHIDTVVHADFLRPSLIDKVNVPRPKKSQSNETTWVPYPSHRPSRPSYLDDFFDESYNLCEIARDISQALFATGGASSSISHKRHTKETLYERLCRWYDALPENFGNEGELPPYFGLLKMWFHTLVINLFSYNPEIEDTVEPSDIPKTPESPTEMSPSPKYNEAAIVLAGAQAISTLVRQHRRHFGMSRAHHFALYAINLALFTMVDQGTFDILDPNFLALSSAFTNMAPRSQLGRNLFHMFRQSVRAKGQGQRIRESNLATYDLRALFDESSTDGSRWDEYAKGLEKLDGDVRYQGTGAADGKLMEMLDRYESLSLGKDEVATERLRRNE